MAKMQRSIGRLCVMCLVVLSLVTPLSARAGGPGDDDDEIDTIAVINSLLDMGFFWVGDTGDGSNRYIVFSDDAGNTYMVGAGPNHDIIYFPSGGGD
jgi:hypothetical protein